MSSNNKIPQHIKANVKQNPRYYSMDVKENVLRAKQDNDYLSDVILHNENLIWHSVHKYIGKPDIIISSNHNCIDKDDILQLGRLGFLKSVKAFDVDRGVKFSSFSVTAIVREIRCFLRDSASVIRPTRTANDIIIRINKLEQELGYLPCTDDIAILLDEHRDKISKALCVGKTVKYLDEPISDANESLTVLDTLQTATDIENLVVDQLYVDTVIQIVKERLNETEIQVLEHRLNGLNQTQTAKKSNMSQMRVSRIMQKIANMLHDNENMIV